MEYVDGEDLRALLRRQTKLSPMEAVEIMIQICRALDSAHTEGVIHRDLKPQNVMRDPQGRVVVMDFGLARSLESPGMTQTGALVGTLEYMSPEQAMGGRSRPAVRLVRGGIDFLRTTHGQGSLQGRDRHCEPDEEDARARGSDIRHRRNGAAALSAIVSKCLERDPKQRFQSSMDLLRQLEAWQGNPNITPSAMVEAAPPAPRSVQISLTLPGRRSWIWVLAVASVLLIPFLVPQIRQRIFSTASANRGGGTRHS